MRRREFILVAGAAVAWPLAARAQQPARLAWIGSGTAAGSAVFLAAFREGMRGNGLAEGTDYVLDLFWSDGYYERFPDLVEEALARKPAVILVVTIASVRAAQRATKTIPIVFISTNDPVGTGLVASLARPGGNTTGLSSMAEDRAPKLVQLAREVLPNASRIAVLINPLNPSNGPIFEQLRATASTIGMAADAVEVSAPDRIDDALTALSKQRPDALIGGFDYIIFDQRDRIVALAITHGIPVFAPSPVYADAGALLGYGVSPQAFYGRAAVYVKKILSGVKPADLPVEQPTKFQLVVNLKTAKTLGLTIPQSILARADEVIE